MKTTSANELPEFHKFVGEKVATGPAAMTPEDVLDEWRTLHPESNIEVEAAAIQEALDDMANGDKGIPFEEYDREFRKRQQILFRGPEID